MSEIRQASPDNGQWEDRLSSLSSGENGEISDITIEEESASARIEGYEFDGQRILYGEFTFHEQHAFGDSQTSTRVEFMYRADSQLFVLNTGQSDERDGEILREINGRLSEDNRIYPGINCSRQNVWQFIQAASNIGRVRVIDDKEVVDKDELELSEEELIDKMVWDAELFFENPETGEEKLVIYDEESLFVDVSSLRDMEYILQIFEQNLLS